MRRPNRPRHVPQLDLFRPDLPKLEWRQLPAEVRGKAMQLMARMLRERQPPEADDEAAGGREDE
jgi:hypothetical protein